MVEHSHTAEGTNWSRSIADTEDTGMAKAVTTIDITPTWRGLLPVLVELATNATTVEAQKDAEAELQKMATAADRYNAIAKAHSTLQEDGDQPAFFETVRAILTGGK